MQRLCRSPSCTPSGNPQWAPLEALCCRCMCAGRTQCAAWSACMALCTLRSFKWGAVCVHGPALAQVTQMWCGLCAWPCACAGHTNVVWSVCMALRLRRSLKRGVVCVHGPRRPRGSVRLPRWDHSFLGHNEGTQAHLSACTTALPCVLACLQARHTIMRRIIRRAGSGPLPGPNMVPVCCACALHEMLVSMHDPGLDLWATAHCVLSMNQRHAVYCIACGVLAGPAHQSGG